MGIVDATSTNRQETNIAFSQEDSIKTNNI